MKMDFCIKIILMLFLCSFLASCAGMNRVPTSMMQKRLQYRGFSVERPQNLAWYMNVNEQDYTYALFRKDLPTPTHTFVASVSLQGIPRNPESPEDLAAIQKEYFKFKDTSRFELLELKQRIEKRQNQWCVYYEQKIIDHKAPNTNGKSLTGIAHGFFCIHPSFPQTVVHGSISERGLETEHDEQIIDEGEDFLKGIQIESAPGKPVG